ncbi:MAG: GH3 auxin-responsive promoter family protein [Rhodospirillaceae bacterium]|nr:GH3 auxin-responsive promoter family protein [Rhodospirillales bacterium]
MIDATPWLRLYARRRLASLAREDPAQVQQATLLELVRRAAATRFGRDHDFHRIRSVADYQARVRLRQYADFWSEYWQQSYPRLDNVTWPGPIPYLAFTSGTSSGSSKYIPVSRAMVKANRRAAMDVLVHHLAHCPASRVLGGRSFILGGSTALVKVAEGVAQGDLSGIIANEIPWLARPYTFPPREEALEADWETKMARLTRLAAGQDIRFISGTPSWVLAFLERMGRPVFPRLELYVHGGVSFRPYEDRFAPILAGSHAETREVYPASEGFIAIADRGNGQGLRPLLDNGLFLEFVPREELFAAQPTRHWIADVQPGLDYAVILTTCAGLFSYVLGDTVRFVAGKPPRLLVTGRLGYQLNVFGEHLSGEQIEDAVISAAAAAELTVAEFAAGARFPAGSPRGHHIFVVEFSQIPAPHAVPVFERHLDSALCAGSLDYRERRNVDVGLDAPEVTVVRPGFFASWMKRRGRLGGQNKVPRVISDEGLLASLTQAAQDSSLAQ